MKKILLSGLKKILQSEFLSGFFWFCVTCFCWWLFGPSCLFLVALWVILFVFRGSCFFSVALWAILFFWWLFGPSWYFVVMSVSTVMALVAFLGYFSVGWPTCQNTKVASLALKISKARTVTAQFQISNQDKFANHRKLLSTWYIGSSMSNLHIQTFCIVPSTDSTRCRIRR